MRVSALDRVLVATLLRHQRHDLISCLWSTLLVHPDTVMPRGTASAGALSRCTEHSDPVRTIDARKIVIAASYLFVAPDITNDRE